MIFNFQKRTLECPNCNSTGAPDPRPETPGNPELCPICGGSLELGKYHTAVRCEYCDSYNILLSRLSGQGQPSAIIPTQMDKKRMFQLLRDKFAKYLCIVPEIFSESRLKEVIIEYVPYWVYNFGIRASYHGKIRTAKVLGNQTITDVYEIDLVTDLDMSNVPVDASDEMPDEVMDALEPFDFSKSMDFRPEYLSGSNSELFNRDSPAYKAEAAFKASDQTYAYLCEHLRGRYPDATNLSPGTVKSDTELNITTLRSSYYLLPVYKYSYTFHSGKTLDYYVNGQTEEVWGIAPISNGRLAAAIAATITAFAGAAAIITTLIMGIGGAL